MDLKDEERTKTEIFSRVVGYLRPITQWNKGKFSEYQDRTPYNTELDRIEKEEQKET